MGNGELAPNPQAASGTSMARSFERRLYVDADSLVGTVDTGPVRGLASHPGLRTPAPGSGRLWSARRDPALRHSLASNGSNPNRCHQRSSSELSAVTTTARQAALMFSSTAVARICLTISVPRPSPATRASVASQPISSAGTCRGAPLPNGFGAGGSIDGSHRQCGIAGGVVAGVSNHPHCGGIAAVVLPCVSTQPLV
ncbi:hypothetical protein MSIMFI_05403 [Mycobacterium simulans]|nr:hypothetical protein MSIMFI_05403 [Mycobacterium simulans]